MSNIPDAYFAGLIDGEGNIRLEKRAGVPGSFKPTIEVKMSCKRTIDALVDSFGGNVRFRKAEKEGWKDQWKWRVQHRAARAILRRIRPFLITKADDVDILLRYWEERGF